MRVVAACVHLAGRLTARQAVGSIGIVGGLVDGERVHVGAQGDDGADARCMGEDRGVKLAVGSWQSAVGRSTAAAFPCSH